MILSLIFILLSGMAKGFMDRINFHWNTMPFYFKTHPRNEFWNPKLSWRNKYKDRNPENGSRFLFSTNLLVFTTDGWHLAQWFMLLLIGLAVVVYTPIFYWIVDFVIIRLMFGIGFFLTYKTKIKNA